MLANRTGASCELCHTVFPGMTNYGMMVMMSNFSMTPYVAGRSTGFTSLVFEQDYNSSIDDDPAPPKFHTDNLGFLSGGYFGPHFTYYLEQHVIDGGFIGGTDQMWMSYNELFNGTGSLQFGKFHTPFPFMPAHRITIGPYATTSAAQGENDFNEDDSHWGVTLSQMQGTLMYGVSLLGGSDLIGPGAFQLAGDHSHSVDLTMMTMSDRPLNYGVGIIRGETPVDDGIDAFARSALYLQYIPANAPRLQFQAVAQIGSDTDSSGFGLGSRTRGGFLEAQYQVAPRDWSVLRWDTQTGDGALSGATFDFIHQITLNTRLTIEGRKLTTGDSFGAALEWAGPWSTSHILATPVLGSMPGMNMTGMNMGGMNMGGSSPLVATLRAGDAGHGSALFAAHGCAQCHGAGGAGGRTAPALVGVAQSLVPESIYDFIKHPRSPMPDFQLSDKDISDLVAFVDSLTPGHTVVADLDAEHSTSGMAGMSGMSGMSMAVAPPVYKLDQVPLDEDPHGHFPGIESGDPRAGATLFAANCASCHGVHNIFPPSDPRSTINPKNLAKTCGACHPGAGTTFAIGPVHVRASSASEHPVVRWIRLIYWVLIPLTILFMVFHNAVDFFAKLLRHTPRVETGEKVPRMNLHFRIEHWLVVVSFPTLVVTGFALKFPGSWWARPMLHWEGLFAFRGTLHRIAAVVLIASLVYHVVHLAVSRRDRSMLRHMIPVPQDLRDLVHMFLYNFGLADDGPQFGKFSYAEKIEYLAFMWGTFVMVLTGFLLWFNNFSLRHFPKWVSDAATALHYYEAILATLAILIWHFYTTIFDPDVYPLDLSWLTGKASADHLRHTRPAYLRALQGQEKTGQVKAAEAHEEEKSRTSETTTEKPVPPKQNHS